MPFFKVNSAEFLDRGNMKSLLRIRKSKELQPKKSLLGFSPLNSTGNIR